MSNLMQRGQAMLNRTLAAAAGVPVTYTRAGQFIVSVTAWVGQEQVTAATVGTTLKPRREDAERDYLIDIAELVTEGGEAFIPKEGDLIAETLSGVTAVFRITPRDGEKAWRWSDNERTRVRCHAKRVQ